MNVEGDSNGGPGDVNSFFDLSGRTFGSNGFLTLLQKGNTYSPNSSATNLTNTGSGAGYGSGAGSSVGFNADNSGTDFENPAHTIFLITTATAPTLTTDIDGNNDGVADGSAFGTWSILDSVGVVDGGTSDTAYGAINFLRNGAGLTPAGANNITTSFTGEYVGRIGDSFGSTASDWVAGDIGGVNPTDFAFANASNSAYVGQLLSQMQLGSFNAVPEPGTMALLGVGVLPLYGAMRSRKKAAKRG